MAIFNFLENFFFISLAITFGLLLLLVYHFKERMSFVEKKSDTLNEIITNVVKEMKSLRLAMIQDKPFGVSPHQISPVPVVMTPRNDSVKPPVQPVVHIPFNQPSHIAYTIQEYQNASSGKIVVSDESDSELSDADSNTETKHDESDSDSDSDNESEEEVDSESEEESVVEAEPESDDDSDAESVVEVEVEPEPEDEDASEPETGSDNDSTSVSEQSNNVDINIIDDITVVNSEIPEKLEVIQEEPDLEVIEPHLDIEPPTISSVVENSVPVLPDTHVLNKGLPEKDVMPTNSSVSARNIVIEPPEPKDPKKEVFRKMNINQLRTIAISHGLSQDSSKMKKSELIKLLEGLDDE